MLFNSCVFLYIVFVAVNSSAVDFQSPPGEFDALNNFNERGAGYYDILNLLFSAPKNEKLNWGHSYPGAEPTGMIKKRSSVMLNRLKLALNKALNKPGEEHVLEDITTEDPGQGPRAMSRKAPDRSISKSRGNGLTRTLVGDEGVSLWKCYFNAVTCF